MINLIKELEVNDIHISLDGDDLQISFESNEIDGRLLKKLKDNKSELVNYMRKYLSNNKYKKIELTDIHKYYPLSSAQLRLWTLSQIEEGSIAYNMPNHIELDGFYDIECFTEAINSLIERHEILRTVFRPGDSGEVMQYVLSKEELGFKINYIDFKTSTNSKEEVNDYIREDSVKAFDLEKGPLLRASLLQVSSDRYVFYFNIHHIIGDGWSMEILSRDVLSFYESYKNRTDLNLPVLNIQYKDYASWQLEQSSKEQFKVHKDYWVSKLSGDLSLLDLPSSKTRPVVKTYNGNTLTTYIDKNPFAKLKNYVLKNNGTLFMGIMSSMNALLYRYTSQEDIIIGTPVAGRDHSDLENQIGFYINALVLRNHIKGSDSFNRIYESTRKTILESYAHQMYPFDHLVGELNQNRLTSRSAIFDMMLVLQNYGEIKKELSVENATDDIIEGQRTTSIYDVKFSFEEIGEYLRFVIEYNSDVYEKVVIENFMRHYKNFLKLLLEQPNENIELLDFLDASERKKQLATILESKSDYPKETIVKIFEDQVLVKSNYEALIYGNSRITYDKLNEKANKIAHFLIDVIGVHPEEKIGLLLNINANTIAAILGVLKAGCAYVPLDTATPEERLKFIMKDINMKILVTEKEFIEVANRLQWQIECFESYISIDSENVLEELESKENLMMDQQLWDHVGERSDDEISGGGWLSSYTGNAISKKEMEEYSDNAYKKLSGSLYSDMRVLEIGCSSGLTMSKIAPKVGFYFGTDLSPVILSKTSSMVKQHGFANVKLKQLVAHEISKLEERDFDLIIINSVIQHFHGHNYLRKVIADCIDLIKETGQIFIGDIMDIAVKDDLIKDLEAFKSQNKDKNYKTKTDFSAELFVDRRFFEDLTVERSEICNISISEKIHTIENELTRFRYDVILEIEKNNGSIGQQKKHKNQYSRALLDLLPITNPNIKITPDQLMYVIYTSGTTGNPKGVLIEHRNVVRLLKTDKSLFDFTDSDVWTMFHSYSFDFSVWEMYGALLNGGKLVLVPKLIAQDPKSFLDLLKSEKVTVLNQTPLSFYNLSDYELQDLQSNLKIRYVIFGGEALSPIKLSGWFSKYPDCNLINMYGITETTVHTTYKKITNAEIINNTSNIGKPIPTVSCFVLDQNRQLLPIGVSGELYVGGEGVARGYLNREELTSERFIENPFKVGERLYRSGDKVKLLVNGDLEYLVRIDQQVKIRGYRIELGEIENTILRYSDSLSQVLVEVKEVSQEKVLVAYMVFSSEIDKSELRSFLQEQLPDYMIPSFYVALSELPLTPNGKIDRKALPSISGEDIVRKEYVAPRNEIEAQLAGIWQEVLGVERIGITDNFFELGGHSLMVAQVINRVHKQLGKSVSFKVFFANPTLSGISNELQVHAYATIPKAQEASSYPLTAAQGRLWVLSQLEGGGLAYNMPAAVKLSGILSADKFEESFRMLIARHEILRTYFKTNDQGEVRQHIIPIEEVNFRIALEDYSSLENPEVVTAAYLEQSNSIPFDLEQGPLVRASLIKQEESYVFFLSMHHIIGDGWSMELLISDIVKSYNALIQGTKIALPALNIQYKDYAVWLTEEWQQVKHQASEQYWLQKFEGELPVLDLPNFKARPLVQTYSGDSISHQFSKTFLEKLKAISKEHDVTLFMILMAGINALLHRYTGQDDIILGTPIAGREHPDLEHQLGLYLNTLAIRTQFKEKDSFLDLVLAQKETLLGAYEHQGYPFDALIRKLNLKRDTSRSALFDVLVVLQNQGQLTNLNTEELINIEVSDYGFSRKTSQFDISFAFTEIEGLDLTIEYNTDIYDGYLIGRMFSHFENLVTESLEQPKTLIQELEYLTEEEKTQLLFEFNDTNVDYPKDKTIVDLFEEQVAKTPNNIAVVFEEVELTYKELNEKANQLAFYLRENYFIEPDDLLGIKLEKSEKLIIAILGVLKSGAAYVPIDPNYPQERITYIEKDSECKVVVDEQELDRFHEVQKKYLKENIEKINQPNDLAYIIYTSGTTGNPKGVMIENRNTVELINWSKFEFDSSKFEIIYAVTSCCFDLSIYEIFYALTIGKKIRVLKNALEIKNHLKREKKVLLNTVPSVIKNLLEENIDLKNITFINMAGEIVPIDIIEKLQIEKIEVRNLYGPSEDTTYSTTYKILNQRYNNLPIGKPISNTQVYILDENLLPVPIGVTGKMYISGVGLARGYLNKPELTAEKFIVNPFIEGQRMYDTGDLGCWLVDGNIEFIGREDHQVKIRGFRIELGEIENTIVQYSADLKQVVVAVKENNQEKVLVAYLVSTTEIDKSELRCFLQEKLPDYMVPSFYVALEILPLTPNGKINRKALPSILGEDIVRKEYVAPRNEVEEKLVAIWQEVLGIEKVGVTDNFFELGGHSMIAIKILHKINEAFNFHFGLDYLFNSPTISKLSEIIFVLDDSKIKATEVTKEIYKI